MRTLFLLLLGLALIGLAAVPAPASDEATISKLIEQLGADSFADREAASKALDKIGTPALEAVQKATKSADAEVRKRAAELAGRIGRRAASEATLAPKMVRLEFKDTPVKEAVKALAEKSGYDIVLSDPEDKLKDKKVTLDTGKVTFWAAMEKFRAAAGIVEGDPNTVNVAPPPPAMGPRVPFAGPAAPAGGAVPRAVPAPPAPAPVAPLPPKDGKAEKDADPAPVAPQLPPKDGKVEKEAEAKEEARVKEAKVKEDKAKAEAAVREAAVLQLAAVMREVPPPAPGGAVPPKPMIAPRFVAVAPMGMAMGYHVSVPHGQITLVPGEEKVVADTSSSIRVRAVDRKRYPVRAGEKEVGVILEVSAEPRLMLQQVQSLQIDVVEDDNGQKLTQVGHEAAMEAPVGGLPLAPPGGGGAMPGWAGPRAGFTWFPPSSNGLHLLTGLKLTKGEKASKSLKRLEGVINANLLGAKEEMLVVESPGKAAGKSAKGKQGGEINVTAVTKQADGSVQLEFDFEAPNGVLAETRYRAAGSPNAATARGGLMRVVAGGVALPVVMPGQSLYAPWGLTLQDDKGNAVMASIRPNNRKLPGGGGKLEYLATYQPGKDGKGEPTRLVYTGRRQVQAPIPFKLAGVELK